MNNFVKTSLANEQSTKRSATAARLKRYLLFLLVFLPGLAVIALLFFSNLNNERILLKQARTLLVNTTAESLRHTQDFLKNAEKQAALTTQVINRRIITKAEYVAQEDYFVALLELHPDIAGLYVGDQEGNFFYVSRSVDASKAKYRVKRIQRADDGVITNIWWRNENAEKIDPVNFIDEEFDPRERPWYIQAHQKQKTVWTEPYIFFTTQKLGITTAAPLDSVVEDFSGAVGVDLELTELAQFLARLEISRYGSSFITTDNGTLIASPFLHEQYKTDADQHKLKLLNIMNSDNENSKLAFQAVFTDNKEEFVSGKSEFLVESMPLKLTSGKNWQIITYAEKNEFLSEIRDNANQKYLIAALVTIIAILLGWFVARSAWQPIIDLEARSHLDPLTQVFNRRYLNANVDSIVSDAISRTEPLSIAIIDIDHFKPVNDNYGHHIGDLVLKAFAQRLINQSRKLDILARFGGEEFILIMPNTSLDVAHSYVDNTRKIIGSRLYNVEDYVLKVTFSAGISGLDSQHTSFQQILDAADKALYRAKEKGRDQVQVTNELGDFRFSQLES